MLTWLNVFVNNLSQPLFWFTLVGSVFCFVIGILSLLESSESQGNGSIGYATCATATPAIASDRQ
jgi:hypothetical protein